MRFFIVSFMAIMQLMAAPSAQAHDDHPRVDACHFILAHQEWNPVSVVRFIRCADEVWNVPGTPKYIISIARCESGLRYRAYNSSGPYLGIFQHVQSAWSERVERYIQPLHIRDTRWLNPEVNILIALRMAISMRGWPNDQWSCA